MNSSDLAQTRIAAFRASLRLTGARRALDVLLEAAPALTGYHLGPAADEGLNEMHYISDASGQSPFTLDASDGELMFNIHEAGFGQVAGGLPALEAGLGPVSQSDSGVWRLSISTPVQADVLSRLLFVREQVGATKSRYWWVNLARAQASEIEGGYLWSPQRPSAGSRIQSKGGYSRDITSVMPGDIVFAQSGGEFDAIGVVLERARSSPDPERAGGNGWLVPMRFEVLSEPLRLDEHLPKRKRPRSARSAEIYLVEATGSESALLRRLLHGQVEQLEELIAAETDGELVEQAVEEYIWQRSNIGPLDKRQLSSARRGRGVFRENVERAETACRVTGILDRRYLRAAHIKPWKDCDDTEKLDGANGLLFSPHIVHLFNRGHISFADEGTLLISRHLNPYVLKAWGLERPVAPHAFRSEQRVYLEYHRAHLFERISGGRRTPGESV